MSNPFLIPNNEYPFKERLNTVKAIINHLHTLISLRKFAK